MSIQQLFSSFIGLIGVLGVIGSSQLSIAWANNNIGPGTIPMSYSVILLVLSVMLFFNDRKVQPRIQWRKLLERPAFDGLVFFLLNLLMFVLIYLLGTVPAMAIFSVAGLLCLKRQTFVRAIIFSIIWVAALYIVFVVLLGVPFETGLLLKLMR